MCKKYMKPLLNKLLQRSEVFMSLTYAKQPLSQEYEFQPRSTFVSRLGCWTAQTYKYIATQKANIFKLETPHDFFFFFFYKRVHSFMYLYEHLPTLLFCIFWREKKLIKL